MFAKLMALAFNQVINAYVDE